MPNKKGLLGMIFIIVILFLAGVGFLVYYHIKHNGIQIASGNFVVNIKFNGTNSSSPQVSGNYTLNKTEITNIINKTVNKNYTITDYNSTNSTNDSSYNLTYSNISNHNNSFK